MDGPAPNTTHNLKHMPCMTTPSRVYSDLAADCTATLASLTYVVGTGVHVSQPLRIELPYTGDVSLHHMLKARPQVGQQFAPVAGGGSPRQQRKSSQNKLHFKQKAQNYTTTQKYPNSYHLAIGKGCSGCHGFRIPVVKIQLAMLCSIFTHSSSAATSLLVMMSWKRTHTCTHRRRPMAS